MFDLKKFVKIHPGLMDSLFFIARISLRVSSFFIPINKKTMMFASLGGRNYDDSPRELYEYIHEQKEFSDWHFYWGLDNPSKSVIPGATIVKFGSLAYWHRLLSCQVWIGNGGIDKGIEFSRKGAIIINTWHGTPIKRIQGEENSNKVLEKYRKSKPLDKMTIRCCQSDYDLEIFARVFNADKGCFIQSGLPRNDKLLKYNKEIIDRLKLELGIPKGKRILLYMPTYREFDVDKNNTIYLKPPIDLRKWENILSEKYVLLVRAHYAVSASLGLVDNEFIKNVSKYAPLTDLYAIADILISDYSSAFFDYSIYGRPMCCFAYDLERYEKERGFYMNLDEELPCPIMKNEDELLQDILNMNIEERCIATKKFAKKYIPNEGTACKAVTDFLKKKIYYEVNS